LAPRDIARIGMQAAQGLAAAHAQGLVHRDVKPANILLENGVERVKLTDFGLARAADDARITQSGVAAGTPLYMSPEQARGEAVDARSDLFSLGSVLYTLATGFPPFRAGSAMGVLHRIINDPPRPIRDTIPDFPPDLEAIIMQLLEKDPAKRFQLGADVSFRLSAFLARPHPHAVAPAVGEAEDGSESEKTKPWVLALVLLAAAAMVVVVLTFRTSRGTLVVEVDDPGVKVALDGEELTITGAGSQEVRLKPGTYHVTAAAPDGKVAKVSPAEVVTIKKDGKQIVKVTVEPAAGLPAVMPRMGAGDTDALFEDRMKAVVQDPEPARLELMRYALKRAQGKPTARFPRVMAPETNPQYPAFAKLVLEAAKADTPPDRARSAVESAHLLAGMILDETAAPKTVTGPKEAPKTMDPEWEAKLDPLMKQFQDLTRRLAGTSAGPLILLPGPVTDLERAVASVKQADRDTVKRLLTLRDQFALLIPRAQVMAVRLHELKDAPANPARTSARQSLEEMHTGLVGQLRDMEKIAAELGAKPYQPNAAPARPPAASRNEWEDRLKKLVTEADAVADRLVKTAPGRVLLIGPPDTDYDKATAGMDKDDAFRAKRLLALRDQFRLLVPEAQKGIGRWEKARHEIRVTDLEAARIELADSERDLRAAEDGMTRILADLKKLADEIDAA
ncbi:MAG: serine/threonine protein kinase, partial [Zavarzinella sp.]|nr:serine/threonine protein kinase [Zavarzinella sp.]